MAAILLGIALSVVDSTIVSLALPDITRHFGASPSAAVWVINANQLASLGVLLPCAHLGERFGYRRVYLVGLAVYMVGLLGCVLAPGFGTLLAARALQGVGAAGMMAVNPALVRLTYPADVLPRGIALNSVVVATATVAGPTLAALVLAVASWPWLFLMQLPLCVLVFFLARAALPANATRARDRRLAPLDVALNLAMFVLVFLAADMFRPRAGGSSGEGLVLATGLLAAGLAVGWVHVRRQARQAAPLLPVDLLRIRIFALSMCTSIAAFSAQTLAFIALPFLLLEGQGRTHLETGLLMTAWPAAIVVTAPVAGRLIHRLGGGLLGGVGLALMATGLATLALLPAAPAGWAIAAALALCGAGFGLFQSPNNHTIVTSAPLQRAGAAGGMLGTARLTGQSLGAVLLGLVFGLAGVRDGGPQAALGLAAGFAAAAAAFSALRMRK